MAEIKLSKLKFQEKINLQIYHSTRKHYQKHSFFIVVVIVLMKVYQVKTFTRLHYQNWFYLLSIGV